MTRVMDVRRPPACSMLNRRARAGPTKRCPAACLGAPLRPPQGALRVILHGVAPTRTALISEGGTLRGTQRKTLCHDSHVGLKKLMLFLWPTQLE